MTKQKKIIQKQKWRQATNTRVNAHSPRSISVPPETRSPRPTRSQGDADETVLDLQPDLPLAKRLCSPSIEAWRDVVKAPRCRVNSTERSQSVLRRRSKVLQQPQHRCEASGPVLALWCRSCGESEHRQPWSSQIEFRGFRCDGSK